MTKPKRSHEIALATDHVRGEKCIHRNLFVASGDIMISAFKIQTLELFFFLPFLKIQEAIMKKNALKSKLKIVVSTFRFILDVNNLDAAEKELTKT